MVVCSAAPMSQIWIPSDKRRLDIDPTGSISNRRLSRGFAIWGITRQPTKLSIQCVKTNRIKNNQKLFSIISYLQTHYHFKLDFEKVGHQTRSKWVIYVIKHRKNNIPRNVFFMRWDRGKHKCRNKQDHHWFSLNQDITDFIYESIFENVVCKMTTVFVSASIW